MDSLEAILSKQEFLLKMNGEHDRADVLLEVNGGSGGTEAQDWAEMLLRMYVRWSEKKGFKTEIVDYLPGEVAGLKSATISIQGDFAYGLLRSEQGVHRLVRISPFDSNARRHTSFASVSVTPEIEEDVEIVIDPTGLVVACQIDRSQHKNKERAMKMLKAKLYEREQQINAEKMDAIKGARMKIDFGSQIRSYVFQPYQMVKDLRTNFETSSIDKVMDGEIDGFIEAYLVDGVKG
jgi:peptide chain release factor 2